MLKTESAKAPTPAKAKLFVKYFDFMYLAFLMYAIEMGMYTTIKKTDWIRFAIKTSTVELVTTKEEKNIGLQNS